MSLPQLRGHTLGVDAALGRFVLYAAGSRAWRQRGFAPRMTACGIDASRALSVNAEAGSCASPAMGLRGVLGALEIAWVTMPLTGPGAT